MCVRDLQPNLQTSLHRSDVVAALRNVSSASSCARATQDYPGTTVRAGLPFFVMSDDFGPEHEALCTDERL